MSNNEPQRCRDVFRRNLLAYRTYSGLTAAMAAARTGVSRSSWVKYERGERFPNAEGLDDLADAAGVTVADLFTIRDASMAVE